MILLDTMVVSELHKSRPSSRVMAWAGRYSEDEFFISVITIGEIERGIAGTRDAAFRAELARWLDGLMRRYADRMLDVTAPIARRWGEWTAGLGHEGVDLLIAATADVHGLIIATRNVRHFKATGVATIDPFV